MELILLTWREQTAFRIDPDTLQIIDSFNFTTSSGQGWGIACDNDSNRLYISDGTQFLHTWESETMKELSKVSVRYRWPKQSSYSILQNLNELEWDGSMVLANVWYQDVLVRIHPTTGFVHNIYDLSTLRPREDREPGEDCMNGIAMDRDCEQRNVLWVTGKYWPAMYKIKLL